jgi:anti-sigma factor RsiW
MKTFEEKWTAWLDGQLSGRELAEFEALLPDKAAAEAEKADVRKLGALLKRELGVSALTNEEFFSHQLRERIRESSVPSVEPEAKVDPVVSPNATVSMFKVKQDRVTVLWTEGLQSLPADYAAK